MPAASNVQGLPIIGFKRDSLQQLTAASVDRAQPHVKGPPHVPHQQTQTVDPSKQSS